MKILTFLVFLLIGFSAMAQSGGGDDIKRKTSYLQIDSLSEVTPITLKLLVSDASGNVGYVTSLDTSNIDGLLTFVTSHAGGGTDNQTLSLDSTYSGGVKHYQISISNGNTITLMDSTGSGSSTITDLTGNNWKVFYTDGSSNVTELALGTSGQVLTSNGASSAPTFETPSSSGWNYSVQAITTTWDVDNGLGATTTMSGNKTITVSNLVTGMSGNLTVTCESATDTLTFSVSGATIKTSPFIYGTASHGIPVTNGSGAKDVYSWWYDGTNFIINGTKNYE